MFTKKHYTAIAQTLRELKQYSDRADIQKSVLPTPQERGLFDFAIGKAISEIEDLFSRDNPNFSSEKFNAYINKE